MSDERALLEAARAGDEDAFARLVEPYRAQLRAHCYRMLGSLHDAEDALQETLLRAWRGLARFEGRSSFRSWLYTIATNASLRAIEQRPKRILPIDFATAADPHGVPAEALTEPVWLEPYPDTELGLGAELVGPDARYEQRESIELAFTAALQHLPPQQRAVLILRDVLGFSARETAAALETTPVSVDSALQRAHRTIDKRVPRRSQQEAVRALGDGELHQLVTRFADAWEQHDVDGLVSLLTDDARMTMPPQPSWYQGRDAIATFLGRFPLAPDRRFRLRPTGANGQPALAGYIWDEETSSFEAESILVLTLRDQRIEEITAFRTPEVFPHFGLPERYRPELEETMTDLSHKTIVVVGASRGLGHGIATALAEAGAHVVAVSRTPAALPANVKLEVADGAEPTTAASLLDRYEPNVVVLVAGATPHMRPLQQQTWETFSVNWQTDVRIAFHWLREALLKPLQPGSRVIVFSSGAALNPNGSPLSGGYAGAKATQRFITAYAQDETTRAGLDITFTTVLPRFAPATGVGRPAVHAYAAQAGLPVDEYLRQQSFELLTPDVAGAAVAELARADTADVGAAYVLSGAGLEILP